MGQALRKFDEVSLHPEVNAQNEPGRLYNLELERRLKALGITMDEYRRRVAIKLKGYKIGVTSDAEVDILLGQAPRDILAELESLWEVEDGKWQGWKLQSGKSIDRIGKYVMSVLEDKEERIE